MVVVDWPNMGIVSTATLQVLLNLVNRYKRKGVIEIGCVGGHGRTGTLLAMLAIYFGEMQPGAAITHIRSTYCEEAIESYKQESALYRWGGEEPPPPPTPPVTETWIEQENSWLRAFEALGG